MEYGEEFFHAISELLHLEIPWMVSFMIYLNLLRDVSRDIS